MCKWIPLNGDENDVLPAAGVTVLAYDKESDRVVEAYCWRGKNFKEFDPNGSYISWQPLRDDDVYSDGWHFTHWMPKPAKPGAGEW